jgi:hypothetical protein
MTIDEIRAEAVQAAHQYEIKWDALSDALYREQFIATLNIAREMQETLESLYTKLSSNKSVTVEGEASPLPYQEQENYRMEIAEALYENMFLCEIYNKYEMVENVMSAAYPLDNPS